MYVTIATHYVLKGYELFTDESKIVFMALSLTEQLHQVRLCFCLIFSSIAQKNIKNIFK